jgi:hypothetical protein
MKEIMITVVGTTLAAVAINWLNIGTTKISVSGHRQGKAGKRMIILSILMIVGGIFWTTKYSGPSGGLNFEDSHTWYGVTLTLYGVLLFLVGRIIAWYQRP